ncbi:hypothetical protein EJ04DRAFT_542710 [Polyplosphaeria fusca]|uniref:Xylanolytic transcriptional activator regulatory domain-containing protein n=1 Tax=Polyplosphaeria fusca TaxID=682080 RepID=A0A9P4R3K5_9PLEO|nr:hypothetical protein EJ04DRAFT_542710 [Polyplosphaeria fusca]
MFTTFSTRTELALGQEPTADLHTPLSPGTPRSKRQQVSRACVWCRTYRIKEIERLRSRVKELEEQLEGRNAATTKTQSRKDSVQSILPVNLDPHSEHGGNKRYYNWEFISTRTARSNQQCYGPSSSFYFIGQMTSYLDMALQQKHSDIQLTPVSRLLASPVSTGRNSFLRNLNYPDSSMEDRHMSQAQEESLFKLFFQSYHCLYPILDEAEFRTYHKSLWETVDATRKPSALVDIVLAICLQYGASSLRPDCQGLANGNIEFGEATIAGRWYYRKCQSLLTDELEGPSIRTFQCHILSVIWLSNASFQNMAHSVLAIGIRTGVILGLHLDPPQDLLKPQREFRKRLWWTMYALEIKTAMELGRPLAVSISQVNCSIPEDRPEPKNERRSSLSFYDLEPQLHSFNTHFVRLMLATRAIYITFYEKCAQVSDGRSLYHNHDALEICAEFLLSKISYLQSWQQHVPDHLKTKRRDAGQPFSTDRSSMDVNPTTPPWLPRQRLFLELTYHDHSMSLYRPFITFSKASNACIPLTEGHAISCVNHAITMTNIIYQMITETDFLSGWHETFRWQWNATLSLIGYILAYPVGPSTPAARKAVSTTINIFELLSKNFASAASAANVARDLSAKADLLIDRFRTSLTLGHPEAAVTSLSPFSQFEGLDCFPFSPGVDVEMTNSSLLSRLTEDGDAMFQNTLTSSSGFVFSLDGFPGIESMSADVDNVFDLLDFGEFEG